MYYAQYCRLHVHVNASNRILVRKAHGLLARNVRRAADKRDARHSWLRAILSEHADAGALVRHFRL